MTLIQMEYFITAATELNFTKAATKLSITQQSLSASIAALENELGCQLFVRRVPLELTYAGNVFLKYANDILRKIDALKHDFSDIRSDQRGILRIGIAPTRGRSIMPDIIDRFRKQYPGIQIVVKEDTNDGLRQDILNGDIDIAIANFETDRKGIVLRDFYNEEVVLFALDELLDQCFGEEKENIIAELKNGNFTYLKSCPFVLGNPKDIAGKISTTILTANSIQPITLVNADNVELLLALCLKGIGFCFCPIVLAKTVLSKEQYQSLHKFHLGDMGKYQIRFGYREEERIWSVLSSFMEIAVDTMQNMEYWKHP